MALATCVSVNVQFSQYGDIVSVILRVKHIGDDIRTWAFVEYGSTDVVESAIAGSESLELGGVPCTVEARKSTPTPRCDLPTTVLYVVKSAKFKKLNFSSVYSRP